MRFGSFAFRVQSYEICTSFTNRFHFAREALSQRFRGSGETWNTSSDWRAPQIRIWTNDAVTLVTD